MKSIIITLLVLSTPPSTAAEQAPVRLELEIQASGAPASPVTAVVRATAAEPVEPETPAVVLDQEAQIPGRVALMLEPDREKSAS